MEMLHVQKSTNDTNRRGSDTTIMSLFPMQMDLGHRLTETYLRRAQPRHPFLARSDILSVCEKVLEGNTLPSDVSDGEYFRAYMIFAIASVYMNQERNSSPRTNSSSNVVDPEALFSVAVKGGTKINLLHGLEGVQNLLLLSRFCFFYLTGSSLWEISSLCLHVCAEYEYHQPPRSSVSAFEEQMLRRVFWQSYCLDRHCSTTLGLPFGIPDSEITVANIVNIEDEHLIGVEQPLNYIEDSLSSVIGNSELSLAISQVRLRRLCSRMVEDFKELKRKTRLYTSQQSYELAKDFATSASAWDLYIKYRNELSYWREVHPHGPNVVSPSSTVEESYLGDQWRDLHYFQEKLLLIRCSIEHSSKAIGMINPLDLSCELYEAASNVIKLYNKLLDNASMEPTPGRLYRILTAGLSVLFTVVIEKQDSKTGTPRDSGRDVSRLWFAERVSVLKLCRDCLETISRHFSVENSGLKYASYFELLCRGVLRPLTEPAVWRNQNKDAAPRDTHEANTGPPSGTRSQQNWTEYFNGVNGGYSMGDLNMTSIQATSAPQSAVSLQESSSFLTNLVSQSSLDPNAGIDSLGMTSPFSWLQNSSSDLGDADLFCHNVLQHSKPCYCALMPIPDNANSDILLGQEPVADEPVDFMHGMFTGVPPSELEMPSLSWPYFMNGGTNYGSMMFDSMDF
jgi:hypothetical protein